jgi:hypothetical protein
MRFLFLLLMVFAAVGGSPTEDPKSPFSIAIVPFSSYSEGGTIEMARKSTRDFYVVLTNVSQDNQYTWEYWNSWGYQTISFELTTAEGKKFSVSKRIQGFTKNYPSTFLVKPGEHEVFAIRFDKWWETKPVLPENNEMPITLKAIYEVRPTKESAQNKVWTGRIESQSYGLTLQQW